MSWEIFQEAKGIHRIKTSGKVFRMAALSDTHWDNPKCILSSLKKTLDYCLQENIPVHINGDIFCLMQGRGDRRGNKSDLRPEHKKANYLQAVRDTGLEWFEPYKDILALFSYGNHETAIIKYQEWDILADFVRLFNHEFNAQLQLGGYGGHIIIDQHIGGGARVSTVGKYFHGSGGGGVVTKGAINLTRAAENYEGYDFFTMGHIHENMARNDVREKLSFNPKRGYHKEHFQIHSMITGTYKEEYQDGFGGWHVERGAPVKPIGGRELIVTSSREYCEKTRRVKKIVDSKKIVN